MKRLQNYESSARIRLLCNVQKDNTDIREIENSELPSLNTCIKGETNRKCSDIVRVGGYRIRNLCQHPVITRCFEKTKNVLRYSRKSVWALVLSVIAVLMLVAEAQAGDGILLFYNNLTGAATTGRADANGNYSDLKNLAGFDRAWGWIVSAGNGLVLFYGGNSLGNAVTGWVGVDGSYQNLKSFAGFFEGHVAVSPRDGMLFFVNNANHVATTAQIDVSGNYRRLRTFPGFDVWTNIVSPGNGLVLFYNSYTGNVVTGRVGTKGSYQDLKSYRNFDQWSQIIATSDGILLFYNRNTGAAATGRIDINGNYTDLGFFQLRPGGRVVSTTHAGGVAFFQSSEAWFGKIVFDGRFTTLGYLNGFDSWSEIAPVR